MSYIPAMLTPDEIARYKRQLVLKSPVRRIEQDKHGVVVTSDRAIVKAKHVIVAVPPILTGKIDYQPGLPDQRVELIDHYPQGTLTKAEHAELEEFIRVGDVLAAMQSKARRSLKRDGQAS